MTHKEIATLKIEDMHEGDVFSMEESITAKMLDDFAGLSGDYSSLHMDDNFAKERGFKGRVAHGVLVTSLLSRLVGMHFPGEHAVIQSMNTRFTAPVYVGDHLVIKAEIDQISSATNTIILKSIITNSITNEIVVRCKISVGFTHHG